MPEHALLWVVGAVGVLAVLLLAGRIVGVLAIIARDKSVSPKAKWIAFGIVLLAIAYLFSSK